MVLPEAAGVRTVEIMMKRLLLAAAAASLLATGPAMAQTVILVRHAEKADQSADPALSAQGEARGAALGVTLNDARVTHILVTPLQRTRLTALLTSVAHEIIPEVIGFDGGTPEHVAAIVARVRSLGPDDVVLVVGHSNTVPLIASALGQRLVGQMRDCEYDRLTVLRLDGGTTTTVVGRYGEPSTCD